MIDEAKGSCSPHEVLLDFMTAIVGVVQVVITVAVALKSDKNDNNNNNNNNNNNIQKILNNRIHSAQTNMLVEKKNKKNKQTNCFPMYRISPT